MKTSISLCAMAASILALSLFTGCDEVQPGATASHGSRHNYALGHYHSTPRQMRIASQRGARHYASLSPARKKRMRENGVRYLAVRTLDPSPDQLVEIKRKAASNGHAVAAGPKKPWHCVMIWDTYAKDVVGTDCYAVKSLPPVGESVHFGTYAAEYVGAGDE